MNTTQIFSIGDQQAVKLPEEYRLPGTVVSIRKEGEAVILEPIRAATWPTNFFAQIRVDDPAFARPAQSEAPAPTGIAV